MRDFVGFLVCMLATTFGRLQATTKISSTSASFFFISSARAFAASKRNLVPLKRGGRLGGLFSSYTNGEQPGPNDSSSSSSSPKREGETGWNHNQPSESSSFWDSNTASGSSSSSSSNEEPRTGWLHNTESKSEREEQTQKQDQSPSAGGQARRRLEMAMKQQARNHRLLSPPTFHATGSAVIVVTEHAISVPLMRAAAAAAAAETESTSSVPSSRVDVYFTIAEKSRNADRSFWEDLAAMATPKQRAQAYVEWANMSDADSMVLYLQGGPGFGAPTPIVSLGLGGESSWAAKALNRYDRVVLMDQRGTGRSTPITKQTLELQFPDMFLLDNDDSSATVTSLPDLAASFPDKEQSVVTRVEEAIQSATDYLSQFRADNIVQDAEEIRDTLLLPDEEKPVNDLSGRPWGCALGQSFGGFCMMTYLSQVADPPQICLLTGGIAPMLSPLDDVYSSLWDRVRKRSLAYYDMYPGDVALIKLIVRKLMACPAPLPVGGTLTARRFLQIGLGLGSSPSSFASLHALFSSALVPNNIQEGDGYDWNRAFLKRMESDQSFDDHPIYYWLHESIYANQNENAPTNWSAHRVYETKPVAFDYTHTSKEDSPEPVLFFGEMVFPWMSEDYAELRGTGLRLMAHALASKNDWGPLYNSDKMLQALGDGQSRAAAAVYYDDMYVDFKACERVLDGPLQKCKPWISNEYQHSGLRDDGAKIFEKLHGMAMGSVRTPS